MEKVKTNSQENCRFVIHNSFSLNNRLRLRLEIYGEKTEFLEVSELVETNSQSIRSKFLSWVFEFGQINSSEQPIVDLLKFGHRVNLWAMSTLAEKSIWKTPEILDALQIIALQEQLSLRKPSFIEVTFSNVEFLEILSKICAKFGCEIQYPQHFEEPKLLQVVSSPRLGALGAIVELVKFGVRRLPFRLLKKSRWAISSSDDYLLVTYFDNFTIHSNRGRKYFQSNYFGNLPYEMTKMGRNVSWLHIFPNSDSLFENFRSVLKLNKVRPLDSFSHRHFTLEKLISIRVLIQTFLLWKMNSKEQEKIFSKIEFTSSDGIWLAPLFRKHWVDSIAGRTSLRNITWSLLFGKFFAKNLDFSTCVYLQENQSWEIALIAQWREHLDRTIIGFPHASVRFWDLRYFYDQRSFDYKHPHHIFPDFTIANGIYAQQQLVDGNIPLLHIEPAEGLRYLNQPKSLKSNDSSSQNILIVGEYDPMQMLEFSSWLSKQEYLLNDELSITVKPHPNYPLEPSYFTPLKVNISNRSLLEILPECGLVIAGGMTSAAVEAYMASVPLITFQSLGEVDLGPLRGIEIVTCSSNSDIDLELIKKAKAIAAARDGKDYFYTDKKIPRWKHILKLDE